MPQKETQERSCYVKSAAVKVLDTGEAEATLTVTGTQKALERLIGNAVVIENGTNKMLGKVTAFSVRDRKGERVCACKVIGARDLDELVGQNVSLTRSQRELPGTGDAD